MFFSIIQLIIYLYGAYIFLSCGCELRRYKGGHRYIKAFYAKTLYQRFFTIMQSEKDIQRKDLRKLTYIGYTGVVISTISSTLFIALSIYETILGKFDFAKEIIKIWINANLIWAMFWGVFSMVVQGVDSLFNRFD